MVRFYYYKGVTPDNQKEKVARYICGRLRDYLELPDIIEIELIQLGPNNYGETLIDYRTPNRIRINLDLSINDIVIPLTHELLHLEQIYQKRLTNTRFGDIIWENKTYKVNKNMSHKEYLAQPWEQDVAEKQQKALQFLIGNQ
jgi:hypothetical protein